VKREIAADWARVCGPEGLDLLARFLDRDPACTGAMATIVAAANAGDYDTDYAPDLDPTRVQVTTSCHLMVLALLHRLTGIDSAQFYKGDPLRYVRMNCLVQRMLGFQRLTLGWPVYGFGAELLGQEMIYPTDQAPGSDPGAPLLNRDTWRDLPHYDRAHPLARTLRDTLGHMARLGKIEPVAHLPAPYSLAAELLGQEALIGALADDPAFVRGFLDLIVSRVLAPWCDDLHTNIPEVWLEMSDASGSPMFVGPGNFLEFAVAPVARLIANKTWGNRVFAANYRGDLPGGAPTRGRRKKRAPASGPVISFDALLQAKTACCPHFLMRLEADAAPLDDYVAAAMRLEMPLYLGIGAARLDRNSGGDVVAAGAELRDLARERGGAIARISDVLRQRGRARSAMDWPGDLYIEDTNAETSIALLGQVLRGAAECQGRDLPP
jgi:hypothetical protein